MFPLTEIIFSLILFPAELSKMAEVDYKEKKSNLSMLQKVDATVKFANIGVLFSFLPGRRWWTAWC